jgi:hypothetical protein
MPQLNPSSSFAGVLSPPLGSPFPEAHFGTWVSGEFESSSIRRSPEAFGGLIREKERRRNNLAIWDEMIRITLPELLRR